MLGKRFRKFARPADDHIDLIPLLPHPFPKEIAGQRKVLRDPLRGPDGSVAIDFRYSNTHLLVMPLDCFNRKGNLFRQIWDVGKQRSSGDSR